MQVRYSNQPKFFVVHKTQSLASRAKFLPFLLALTLLLSCHNEQEIAPQTLANKADTQLKTAFAKSLSKVLVSEKAVRDFLKIEALKTVDGDFDVLYSLVKDNKLSTGKTLEATLAIERSPRRRE